MDKDGYHDNGGKTGWPPGLLQDDCKGLSKWLSNQPDAKRRVREALAELEQEVSWGVDWGRAGDIPCVSIIRRLPNGGIEVMAVEYAPYSHKEKT
jgi:hypothetical protein